jgi:hypothetical protein
VHLAYKSLSLLFLTAALTAPLATRAGAAQEVVVRNSDGSYTRYYDRNHRDYHEWNDREDHSYRTYLGQRHRPYRQFRQENNRRQRAYWNWRHSHPDRD